jgi:hypothetical protein
MACFELDKPMTGMARKPDDRYALPLCASCHRTAPDSQHNTGDEGVFWERHGINPFLTAQIYYRIYGGTGGKPRKRRTTIKPRLPKEERQKIKQGKTRWPKRTFAKPTRTY